MVSMLVSSAAAIRLSLHASPAVEASAFSRMRAFSNRRAGALPFWISTSSRLRSSALSLTMYFLTAGCCAVTTHLRNCRRDRFRDRPQYQRRRVLEPSVQPCGSGTDTDAGNRIEPLDHRDSEEFRVPSLAAANVPTWRRWPCRRLTKPATGPGQGQDWVVRTAFPSASPIGACVWIATPQRYVVWGDGSQWLK